MKKKQTKVEEPAAPYLTNPPAKGAAPLSGAESPEIRYVDDATYRKAADKVFKVHKELFRKLAQ